MVTTTKEQQSAASNVDGRLLSSHAWLGPSGSGGFDLRSDTMTTPTASMLAAVSSCTMGDDVFNEDVLTQELESLVARRTGKETGLFVLSGTMGNQLALRSLLTQPPYSVLCDSRSHIYAHEAGGVSTLTGAQMQPVEPSNGHYLRLQDIQRSCVLGDDIHDCPTRVIALENTIHGVVMPIQEAQRIADFARLHGITMHLDGARIWEACAATCPGAAPLREFCGYFDTISLCLSKGLGAPVGSVLVGSRALVKHARWVRKSIGGGLRQSGVLASAGLVAVRETFGHSDTGEDGLLPASHQMARRVEALWVSMGGRVDRPTDTNMCWLDLESAGCSLPRFIKLGQENGIKFMSRRLVTHYQVARNSEEVLRRLRVIFTKALDRSEVLETQKNGQGPSSVYTGTG